MRVRAAVVTSPGSAFTIEELELGAPTDQEILVRVLACGICRTDLHIRDQEYVTPLPVVPGHEGVGVVEALGAGVTDLAIGDHVILSFPYCGVCAMCLTAEPAYCARGYALSFGASRLDGTSAWRRPTGEVVHGHFFQQSAFATHVVTPARTAIRIDPDLPAEIMAPFACAVQTGAGTVLDALAVRPGRSIAVVGAGSVGLSAVMAAAAANAAPIIAVDVNPARRELALDLGATETLDPTGIDLTDALCELSDGGLRYAVDTTGVPSVLNDVLRALEMRGCAALVGAAAAGVHAPLDMTALLNGRTVRGVIQGDAVPRVTLPRLIDMYRAGLLPVDRLVTRYDFADINSAADDMVHGKAVKPVLCIADA